jgi:hypothetical protein
MELPRSDKLGGSQLLAATLLDAWLSGDRYRLSWELARMAVLPQSPGDGAECDRMDVLIGIACEMQAHADLLAPRTRSARIGVWIDLLDHLSGRGNPFRTERAFLQN